MKRIKFDVASQLKDLANDVPALCSITISSGTAHITVDQTLAFSTNGTEDELRTLFSQIYDGTKLRIERVFAFDESKLWDDGTFETQKSLGNGIMLRCRATKDAADIGKLFKLIEALGGMAFFEQGMKTRRAMK